MTYLTTRCVGMIAISCNVRPFGGNTRGTAGEEDERDLVAGKDVRVPDLAAALVDDAEIEPFPSCVRGAGGALLRLQEVRYPPPRDMCVSERDGWEMDEEADI